MLASPDGVVLVEHARLLAKCSNVTQMTTWFSGCISLGSVKKSNMVNSKGLSCEDYFSNYKIPKQMVEMVSLILMFLYQ